MKYPCIMYAPTDVIDHLDMSSGYRKDFNRVTIYKMSERVFLNGRFLPGEQALVSANDRGFHFADGVYEVVKYYPEGPFCLEEHMERLRNSLAAVRIVYPVGVETLPVIFSRLLEENGLSGREAGVYLQITRGSHPRVHHFPEIPEPTVYACAFAFPSFVRQLTEGIGVITAEDIRWLRCDIKSVSLLANTMLYQQAVERGAGECVLVRDGLVTEATHSTVMAVRHGTVVTHPLSRLILPGITRKVVLDLCRENGIPVAEEALPAEELHAADELFLTGTGSEVMPVVAVDGHPVGHGLPGPVTRLLQNAFFRKVDSPLKFDR